MKSLVEILKELGDLGLYGSSCEISEAVCGNSHLQKVWGIELDIYVCLFVIVIIGEYSAQYAHIGFKL